MCFCSVIVVHESLVCSEQLNCLLFFRKILQLTQILWFSSISVYLNPFQQWLYDFEIHLFTPRTTERLIYNYYRRFIHSLMLQKKKSCIKSRGVNPSWSLLLVCIISPYCFLPGLAFWLWWSNAFWEGGGCLWGVWGKWLHLPVHLKHLFRRRGWR